MTYYPAYEINQLCRERYGTDVPALDAENDVLRAKIRRRDDELLRAKQEIIKLEKKNVLLRAELRWAQDCYANLKAWVNRRRWSGYL